MSDSKRISIQEASVIQGREGFALLADGGVLRTPKGSELWLDRRELAAAMQDEIVLYGFVSPTILSLYTLESAVIDYISGNESAIRAGILFDVGVDYVLTADPRPDLKAKQHEAWSAQREWLEGLGVTWGGESSSDSGPIAEKVKTGLRPLLDALSARRLSIVVGVAAVLGSATLGVMIARRAVRLDDALRGLMVSERHFAGGDASAAEKIADMETATRRVLRSLLTYADLID